MNLFALATLLVAATPAHGGTCTCCTGNYCTPSTAGTADSKRDCMNQYPQCQACGGHSGSCSFSASSSSSSSYQSNPSIIGDNANMPPLSTSIAVGVGLPSLIVGVVMLTLGYKLWKYILFTIGFLAIGAPSAAMVYAQTLADQLSAIPQACVAEMGGRRDHEECVRQMTEDAGDTAAFYAVLAFLLCGIAGGYCCFCVYLVLIFAMGFMCGAGVVGYLVAVWVSKTPPDEVLATDFSGIYTVIFIAGIVGGVIFVKYQKYAIMIGTAFLGSNIIWGCIFQGFAGETPGVFQMVLIWLTAAGGFYVQSNYTSKGVQIDPKTGEVITTITIETSQHTVPLLVPTLEIAAAQPPQAPSHNIFNKARQSLKQYTTLDHSLPVTSNESIYTVQNYVADSPLPALTVGELRRRAAEVGVDGNLIEEARDSDAPKDQLMALIKNAEEHRKAEEHKQEQEQQREQEFAKLNTLTVGDLRQQATSAKVDAELIEIARDGDDPKAELIRLIMGQACGVQPLQRPTNQMIVTCPAEICTGPNGCAMPGANANITGPDGRVYNVAVPAGMQAGQTFAVELEKRPTNQMIVTCPAEICTGPNGCAMPGANTNITGPDGRVYNVAVPAGMQAGQTFTVELENTENGSC